MSLTPEFKDFVMNLSDEKIVDLFADMGISINLDSEPPMVFEDVEQEVLDEELASEWDEFFDTEDEGILFDEL